VAKKENNSFFQVLSIQNHSPESDFFSELTGVGAEYTERQGEANLVCIFQRSGTLRHRGEVACWEKVFLLVFVLEERPVLDNYLFSVFP
jgi:hypothetical protein